MNLRPLLLFLCALLPSWLLADNIPVGKAQELAADFFKVNAQTRNASPQLQLVWDGEDATTRSNENPAFYVFNRTDAPGFVIIAGDDVAMPILGYSHTNTFSTDNMVPNLKGWMQMYRKEILEARSTDLEATAATRSAWTRADVGNVVKQLTTAKWDQNEPYDRLTPEIDGVKAAVGCAATATAIVMKYHEWPPKGVGTLPDYSYRSGSGATQTIPGHALGHEYLWDSMLMEYTRGNYTDEEANAVAQLMYDCGIMIEMMYNVDGNGSSGAYSSAIPTNAAKYMQYDPNAVMIMSEWHGAEKWMQMLQAEIDANRPVLYGGQSKEGGHQFVFDGYTDTGFFSVNWGWGGRSDGFFLLSSLDPQNQGSGGSTGGGFVKDQDAIFGFQPVTENSEPYESLTLMAGNSTSGDRFHGLKADTKSFKENTPFTIQFGFIYNVGNSPFTGVAILSLFDKDGNLKEHISPEMEIEELDVYSGTGHPAIPCEITTKIQPLDYIAASYHNSKSTEWIRLYGDKQTTDMIVVKELDTSLESNSKFNYSKADKVITITTLPDISYSLKTADGVEATHGVTDATGIISIDTKALAAGTYQLSIVKDEYTSLSVSFIIGANE